MKLEIKSWITGGVIFEGEFGSMKLCLKAAVEAGKVLSGADLRGADLSDADLSDAVLRGAVLRGAVLRGAVLSGADLRGAVLRGAVLRGADLSDAVLRGAVLRGAVLSGADLRGAVLRDADLSDAVLRGAVLSDADLSGADLRDAVLTPIRDDIWAVLSSAPAEVPKLLEMVKAGKINGSVYEGSCACLVGTIANAKGCHYTEIAGLKPNSHRPAEAWFFALKPGDTTEKSNVAKQTAEWIEEWLKRMQSAFTPAAK